MQVPFSALTLDVREAVLSSGVVWQLFDELTSSGLTPDISTFTALLKALGRCGRYEDARQMVRRMKDFGATPDLDTYHALIQVCRCVDAVL